MFLHSQFTIVVVSWLHLQYIGTLQQMLYDGTLSMHAKAKLWNFIAPTPEALRIMNMQRETAGGDT